MKTRLLLAAAFLAPCLTAFAEEVLVDESFNTPTGETYNFPPSQGESYKKFHPMFTAWANKQGQVAVTYNDGLGMDNSGGLSIKILQPGELGGYYALNCERLKIPVSSVENIPAALASLSLDFAAKIPSGKNINLYFTVDAETLSPDVKEAAWANRLEVGTIKGTDAYEKFSFKTAEIDSNKLEKTSTFLTDAFKSGITEIVLNLVWSLSPSQWVQGESFNVDDVKIAIVPQP